MLNVSDKSENSETNNLEYEIQRKIAEVAAVADKLPGVVIIHNIRKEIGVEYISPRGERELGFSLKEIKKLGAAYHTKFFNPEDAKEYVPKILGLLERNNNDEIISFFQQVRASERHQWVWYFSTVKILMWDDQHLPLLTITMASPVEPLHHVTAKVTRLLEENEFLRKNFKRYSLLSGREREVLKLLALGKSAAESAESLFISVTTVETHRRNIKKKLHVSSFFELSQYARAFDLI